MATSALWANCAFSAAQSRLVRHPPQQARCRAFPLQLGVIHWVICRTLRQFAQVSPAEPGEGAQPEACRSDTFSPGGVPLLRFPLLISLLAFACTKAGPPSPPAPAAVAPTTSTEEGPFTGKVVETLSAPGYTYLRLESAQGEAWAAIPAATVALGREVTLTGSAVMTDFTSKTLNRTFPRIVFASGLTDAAPTVAPATEIARAAGPNAVTVSELHQRRGALKDQTIAIRGKVVKYNQGILGKNWLHVRDGSGTDAAGDNDLVVTTTASVALGEVVAVSGPVHLDRDLGEGYRFPIIIEDATLQR